MKNDLPDKKEKILDTLARRQMVFALAIGELIEELKGEVKKLSQDRKYKVMVNRKSCNVLLHPDTEDEGFWVECLALAGCSSRDDTVEEALEMIRDAIKGHLAIQAEKRKKKAAAYTGHAHGISSSGKSRAPNWKSLSYHKPNKFMVS